MGLLLLAIFLRQRAMVECLSRRVVSCAEQCVLLAEYRIYLASNRAGDRLRHSSCVLCSRHERAPVYAPRIMRLRGAAVAATCARSGVCLGTGMTQKREPTRSSTNTTSKRKQRTAEPESAAGKSTRGTAAGLRAGAGSATKAKQLTSNTGKQSQKELTKRGGPGRAGNQPGQKKAAAPRAKTPTRGRGAKARAGA
jgi:hypothetical protein